MLVFFAATPLSFCYQNKKQGTARVCDGLHTESAPYPRHANAETHIQAYTHIQTHTSPHFEAKEKQKMDTTWAGRGARARALAG